MKSIVAALAALLFVTTAAQAQQGDLSKGFDSYSWGDKCSKLFSGKGWVEERSRVVWAKDTKNLEIVYGDDSGEYVLHRNITEKPARDAGGVLATWFGCRKSDGAFTFVLMRISLLKYKQLKSYMYQQLGDHTKKFGPTRTWDKDNLYIQLTQNMILIYHK